MKKRSAAFIGWIAAGVIIIAAILFFAGNGGNQPPAPAPGQSAGNPGQPSGVYATAGGNEARNDNFYTSGRISSLASLSSKDKNTLVWISASWCEICHAMRPFVAKTANKYADKLALREINFDDNYNNIILPNHWFGTPIFVVLDKDGNIKDSFSGATESTFDAKLKAASQL